MLCIAKWDTKGCCIPPINILSVSKTKFYVLEKSMGQDCIFEIKPQPFANFVLNYTLLSANVNFAPKNVFTVPSLLENCHDAVNTTHQMIRSL